MDFEIRPLTEFDLSRVHQIEKACYPAPWSEDQLRQELNQAHAFVDVCWVGEEIAGYLCYWLIAGEMQVLNVATAPAFQRQGVAQSLLLHAQDRCRMQGLSRTYLEVRVSNRGAISLYQKLGFVEDGIRPRYYSDNEDALLMVKAEP
ncbi:MAG TPA: ribosomal protein S18-alanine N-acetyltransferase [Geopsychrobacteraceae bacterium]|nr:ribosomal protein S18-alanine N-acetyltransferase [Geopsychrobacteraceae bacterium]